MDARVTTLALKPGMLEAFIRHIQDLAVPAIIAQPGFHGMTLLTDPISNNALIIGFWGNVAMIGATEIAIDAALGQLPDLIVDVPIAANYEVSVQVEVTHQGTVHMHGI